MIELNDIHKSFGGHDVLNGISISVEKSEILVLIGMSGYVHGMSSAKMPAPIERKISSRSDLCPRAREV